MSIVDSRGVLDTFWMKGTRTLLPLLTTTNTLWTKTTLLLLQPLQAMIRNLHSRTWRSLKSGESRFNTWLVWACLNKKELISKSNSKENSIRTNVDNVNFGVTTWWRTASSTSQLFGMPYWHSTFNRSTSTIHDWPLEEGWTRYEARTLYLCTMWSYTLWRILPWRWYSLMLQSYEFKDTSRAYHGPWDGTFIRSSQVQGGLA